MGVAGKHLSESRRIEIARSLFTVQSSDDSKSELHGLCPVHQENNPSFSYNYRKDSYNCLACGATGDLIKLFSEVRGFGQKEGFKSFCQEYGIELKAPGKSTGSQGARNDSGNTGNDGQDLEAVWGLFPKLPASWGKRLEETRGWTAKWIEILDLRMQTHFYDSKSHKLRKLQTPERIAIPIRDAKGLLKNIRLYKPGGTPYKIISWGKSFGRSRLFPASPFSSNDPILLCEGESDTICALSNGFNAITQTSKLKNWAAEDLEPFKGREVVIAYDADQPGQKYARFAADNLIKIAKSVKLLEWPPWMGKDDKGRWPEKSGQDLTDFFVRHGKKPADLTELIVSAKTADHSVPDGKDGITRFFEIGINGRLSYKPRLLAEQILRDMSLLSEPATGLMYRWNNKFWEIFDEDHIRHSCIKYLGDESQKGRVEDASYQVNKLSTIPHGRSINDRLEWVCLDNGMFNLESMELHPHDRDFYATYQLPVAFNPDANTTCSRWLQYLNEAVKTPEVIAQLQEYAGYCLTRTTIYEKCLFLLGPPGAGKSTFLKILRLLVGVDNCASVSFQDLEDQFQRSSLYNKLVNISTEVGSEALESSYFNALVSGDPINAAFKHKNTFTFMPYCKLVFAANRFPRVRDNSGAYIRRLLVVQFKRQFGDDRDPHLEEDLRKELPDIFHWALVGLDRLRNNKGFTDCDESRDAIMDYRRQNNPVLCYVEDNCRIGDDLEVSKTDIYGNYKAYCNQNGYRALSVVHFFRELNLAISNLRQYYPRSGDSRSRFIKGIGLQYPGEVSP